MIDEMFEKARERMDDAGKAKLDAMVANLASLTEKSLSDSGFGEAMKKENKWFNKGGTDVTDVIKKWSEDDEDAYIPQCLSGAFSSLISYTFFCLKDPKDILLVLSKALERAHEIISTYDSKCDE